jgi:hypothetical protein
MTWLGRSNRRSGFRIPLPEQVKKYCSTLDDLDFPRFDPDFPDAHPIQLDISGKVTSAWNRNCALIVAETYVQLDDARSSDVDVVQQMAMTYFQALRRQWDHIRAELTPSARAAMVAKDIMAAKRTRRVEVRTWY